MSKNPQLKQELKESQHNFQESLKAVLILNDIGKINTNFIYPTIRCEDNSLVLLVRGWELTESTYDSRFNDIIFVLHRELEEAQKDGITIIFLNTNCENNSFTMFKSMLAMLPYKYMRVIAGIIILHHSFSQKYVDWFNRTATTVFLKSITYYAAVSRHLSEFSISPERILQYLPQQCLAFENIKPIKKKVSMVKVKLQTFEGLPLMVLEQSNHIGIPVPILALIKWFRDRPQQLKTEGLFRKVAAIDEIAQLENRLVLKQYKAVQDITSPHVITSLLKKILWKSSEPPFSARLNQLVIQHLRMIFTSY